MILLTLAAILILLLLSAFFSGSETALTAASRPHLHQLAENGDRRARLAGRLIDRRESLIGAILLGNNAVNILASALATSLMIGLFGESGVVYATVSMTLLVFVFCEVLPKTFAIRASDRAALQVAPGLRVLVAVLAPVIRLVHRLVDLILRAFGPATAENAPSATEELRGIFDLHAREGRVRKHYRDMLRSILDLAEVEVGEIMTHRKNMATVDANLPVNELIAAALDSPFTRIPLWSGNPDNIVGILHARTLLRALHGRDAAPDTNDILELAYKPKFVPDTTSLAEQLAAFRARREHFALVVDEYGTLQGLVTLEDILEEIVGDIADEYDDAYDLSTSGIQRQTDGSFLIDGAVTIRDLNRALDSRLPDEEASTAAGLILNLAETIPDVGATFTLSDYVFEVVGRETNRITRLRLTPHPSRAEGE